MTIEAERPANSEPQISYKYFAEQVDKKTGVPVGMVPLESVFNRGIIKLGEFPVWHDVGAGVFSSTEYILTKFSQEEKESMSLYVSDPNFCGEALRRFGEVIDCQVGATKIIPLDGNNAIKRVKSNLISLINVVHNVPENLREDLMMEAFDSLYDGGTFLLSTSFYSGWNVSRETMYFQGLWRRARKVETLRRGIDLKEAEFNMWSQDQYIQAVRIAGFDISFQSVELMPCTLESYKLISHDEEWLGNTMPGVDLETASEISIKALRHVAEEKAWKEDYPLPRNTLVIVGTKAGNPSAKNLSRQLLVLL